MNQVPFIGREKILDSIKDLITKDHSRHIVCINAQGGIGKTRLLQEIYNTFQPKIPSVLPNGLRKKEITLAIVPEFVISDWDKQLLNGAKKMADDLGVRVILPASVAKPKEVSYYSPEDMLSNLLEVIAQTPDVIFIGLGNHEIVRPAIEEAIAKNIKVITLDNYLGIGGVTTSLFQDDKNGCRDLFREEIAPDLGDNSEVAIVYQSNQIILRERIKVLDTELQAYRGRIKRVDTIDIHSNNLIDEAYEKALATLKENPDLKAFVVAFDELAIGVYRAIIDVQAKDVNIYSFDLNPTGMALMQEVESCWKATVAVNPFEIGRLAICVATLAAYGREVPSVQYIPMSIVSREDLLERASNLTDLQKELSISAAFIKDPLLDYLSKTHLQEERGLQILDIIDFDDHHCRIQENIASYISEELDRETFQPYYRKIQEIRRKQEKHVSQEEIRELEQEALEAFILSFNHISANRRIVLLFDTTDNMAETEVWYFLHELCKNLENCLFIFAGRNAKIIYSLIKPSVPSLAIELIELHPLNESDSKKYLECKQSLLHFKISQALIPKIVLMASGRPILLDLAVEWLARSIPMDWMSLPIQQLKERFKEPGNVQKLEELFVEHIAEGRNTIDWLWIAMTHVYPLNIQMISILLDVPEKEATGLFDEAKTYVFVKQLPNNMISLHDEMRRILEASIMPIVDPTRERRMLYSSRIVSYFENEVFQFKQEFNDLRTRAQSFSLGTNVPVTWFSRRETLLSAIWVQQVQDLYHSLYISRDKGIKKFLNMFEEARLENQHAFMELILKQVEGGEIFFKFSNDQQVSVLISRVVYLLQINKIQEAHDFGLNIIENHAYTEAHEIDIRSRLGNCARLSGNLPLAVDYFQQALSICTRNEEKFLTEKGMITNALGLVLRQRGKWVEAETYYKNAIEIMKKTSNEGNLATAYTNLGYITGMLSNYPRALRYCLRALEIQERLGREFESGLTHNVLSIIYRGKEEYDKSLENSDQAIAIFERAERTDWLANAYLERGATKWHLEKLSGAEEDLLHSLELYNRTGLTLYHPLIYHRLGHVEWEKKNYQKAEGYFYKSAETGREVSDYQQIINSLEGLVELYYYVGQEHHRKGDLLERDKWFEKSLQMAEKWTKDYPEEKEDFSLYNGSRLRILGNIAFDRGNYQDALNYYLQAYPLIAKRGGYSRYMLPKALDWLQERIDALPPEQAIGWADRIEEFWTEKKLASEYPEVLAVCELARDKADSRAHS